MTGRTRVWAGPLAGRSRLLCADRGLAPSCSAGLLREEGGLFCAGGSPVRAAGGVHAQSSWGAAPLYPHSPSDSEPGAV